MDFRAHTDTHVRLTILRFLREAAGYVANASTLKSVCQAFGLVVTRDQVHTAVAWLHEQGLVTRSTHEEMVLATLTERGLDVAEGRAQVDGVARPSPRLPGAGTAG